MATFAATVQLFAQKAQKRADVILRRVALAGFNGVIRKSPVDTGRFRGNWNVGLNRVNTATTSAAPSHSAGAVSGANLSSNELGRGFSIIASATFGDTIYISNNLHYAIPLEYGRSRQASGGMLRITFEELKISLQSIVTAP